MSISAAAPLRELLLLMFPLRLICPHQTVKAFLPQMKAALAPAWSSMTSTSETHAPSASTLADPVKVVTVRDWPVPCDVGELQSFLGLVSYFRHFVKGGHGKWEPLDF